LVCALIWLALTSVAIASEYHGQVTFAGLPVPGTTVTVTATQGSKKVVAITDAQGIFSFPDLTDGRWTIEIEMTGFAPVKQEVTIGPSAATSAATNTAPNAATGAAAAPAADAAASAASGAAMPTFELKLLSLDQIRAATKPIVIEANAPVVAAASAPSAPAAPGAAAASGTPAAPSATAAKPAAKAAGKAQAAGAAAPAAMPSAAEDTAAAGDGLVINGSVNNAATSQYSLSQAFGNNRNGGRSLYNGGLSLVLDSSALDARPYSQTGVESPKPPYNNMTGGVTFGGPLNIPHLMPRGPYFYIGYQRTQSTRDSIADALVPTAAQRMGNFSGTTIYNPSTGMPYSGDVPISPQAQALLALYPNPNVTGSSPFNYQTAIVNSTHQDAYRFQLSRSIGNKDNVFGYITVQSTRSSNPNLFGFLDTNNGLGMNSTINWTHRFTQRFFMTGTYNFSRSRNQVTPYFANRENISGMAGINGNDTGNPLDPADWAPPTLVFSQSQITSLSDGIRSNNRNETNTVSYRAQWNRPRHNVSVGGDFTRREFNYLQQANPQGTFTFTGAATAGTMNGSPTGGSDFADFLVGVPDTSAVAFGNPDKYLRQSVYDAYADDDFRVSPELSLHAGVRWEYGAPVTELKDRLVNLDILPGFTMEKPVLATSPTGPLTGQSYPTSLVRPDKIGFAPNVAIAWRPISGSSLLIRSSYSINHDTSVYQAPALTMAQQAPLSTSLSVSNSASCPLTLQNGFTPCASFTPDTFAMDPNFRVGYVQTWQVSAQRDLPGSLQMVASYTGIKGTRGVQEFLPNTYPPGATDPCPSCPTGFVYRTSNGDSTRNAGVLTLRRRLRSGFTANLTYTYSKSLDDDYAMGGGGPVGAGVIGGGGGGSGQIAQDWTHPSAQRGLSSFDQRHLLNASFQYTTGMGLGGRTLLSGWRGLIYKEWTILSVITFGTGLPETPLDPVAIPGTGYTGIVRANYTGAPVYQSPGPGYHLNPAAFAAPNGQWGDARRDSITGPDQFSLNATMARTFRLHDRYNLDIQLAASNALNHVTYSSWVTSVGSQLFGTAAGPNGMRSAQLTMRLRF
jgi:hypothetical protein